MLQAQLPLSSSRSLNLCAHWPWFKPHSLALTVLALPFPEGRQASCTMTQLSCLACPVHKVPFSSDLTYFSFLYNTQHSTFSPQDLIYPTGFCVLNLISQWISFVKDQLSSRCHQAKIDNLTQMKSHVIDMLSLQDFLHIRWNLVVPSLHEGNMAPRVEDGHR